MSFICHDSKLKYGKNNLEWSLSFLFLFQIEEGNRTIMEQQSKMEKLKSDAQVCHFKSLKDIVIILIVRSMALVEVIGQVIGTWIYT